MTTPESASGRSVALQPERVSERFRCNVTRDFARRHLVVSQSDTESDAEHLVVSRDTDPLIATNIGTLLQCPTVVTIGAAEMIAATIDEAYAAATRDADRVAADAANTTTDQIDNLLHRAESDLLSTDGKGPIVQLVDALLFDALNQRASDLHIQPTDSELFVRYRIDGVLHTTRVLASQLVTPIVSRIKVMGNMDISERRLPQDGRAMVTIGRGGSRRTIDLRISTIPTNIGERAVIRLLEPQAGTDRLAELGMPRSIANQYISIARSSHGLVLLTGPTGSGKTTTLYATLRTVGTSELNIMTIEDPIEYQLSGTGAAISQSQVNSAKGMTFASGLRNVLRQDPDVIMVGEIRDAETAAMAIQASLTGHLVLSTLHTNDAPSAITRLENLGVERYLIGASLLSAMAQRLVRQTHDACSGRGCDACLKSGFLGRVGLYELLVISDSLRSLIVAGSDAAEIKSRARREGMMTLGEYGRDLAASGRTTSAEVARVTASVL